MKMKRLFACLAIVVLLTAALPVLSLAETYARVTTTNDVLHLREEPSSDSAILGRYRNGTKVQILKNGKWWVQVKTPDGKVGYMYRQYLTNTSSGSDLKPTTGIRYIKSGIGPVNIRAARSIKSKLLTRLDGGTKVILVAEGAAWSRIKFNGRYGFVKTKYLVKKK